MKTLVALAASLFVALPAAAAGDAIASFSWRLDFGAHTARPAAGLTLGYRSGEHFSPLSTLVAFRLSPGAATASIAGLPLFASSYRANQSVADAAYNAGVDEKPWYTRGWVFWTIGGIAATLAVAGAASGGGSGTGESTPEGDNDVCAIDGGNVGPQPLPDACAPNPI